MIALFLGTLYAMGAIQVWGQVEAEDLKLLDVLPLIPLEQVLARGIAMSLLPLAAAVGAMVLTLLLFERAALEDSGQNNLADIPRWAASLGRGVVVGVPVVLIGASLISMPLEVVGVFAVGALVGFPVYFKIQEALPDWPRVRTYSATWILVFFVVTVASAFLIAEPLPDASLTKKGGIEIQGGLVAEGNGTWYLRTDDNAVMAIEKSQVTEAVVESEEREASKSLLDHVLGREPSNLFGEPAE